MRNPERPDKYLAAALEREIQRHNAGKFDEIGSEYDQVEMDTLPFRDGASAMYHLAFSFWDGWVDASNHDWLYYDGISRDDWPRLAQRVVAALRNGTEISDPLLLRYFGPRMPGPLRRLWYRIHGRTRA